jgi:hypothetical protein
MRFFFHIRFSFRGTRANAPFIGLLIHQNPNVEAKLQAEVDAIFGPDYNQAPTVHQVDQLKYVA